MEQTALSRKRAYECEHAIEKRCRCRCGGKLHGLGRVAAADLHELGPDDPHYVAAPTDTGLRTIVKATKQRGRQKKHSRYVLDLACGHQVVLPASKMGENRSRAHCEQCAPQQVMVARQRRAEGMDKTLMEFFGKWDKPGKRFKASRFGNGIYHVIDVSDPDYAIGPGSSKEKPIKEIAALMNKLPR